MKRRLATIAVLVIAMTSLAACSRSFDALWADKAGQPSGSSQPSSSSGPAPTSSTPASPTSAPSSAPSVPTRPSTDASPSAEDWARYQTAYLTSCESAAKSPNVDAAKITTYCQCTFDTIKKNYTFAEFQDLNKLATTDKAAAQAKLADVLKACIAQLR